ncbi:hypothetical protein CCHR01_11549 [Colletotrichum chrysophilum]|uniref:protein-ribulosamine 3-kinase n=1 Tax=Colletotrichum chrysophilum TaxID=1836956 RepID=A0AAD9ADV6_9PEZI|nr:hypothetical protein CCHR01_11549 [Colletotrichum chrysophilum]
MTSLETNILPEKVSLDDVDSVTSMTQLSQSEWATTFCLTIRHRDKSEEQYFVKTAGRTLKPSLVHGDLWYGNASIDEGTGKGIVYDPASFWAHNEYELGNWRPKRNRFTQEYFDAYHSLIAKSDPIEDYDDRNALYAMYVVQAVHRCLLTDLGVQKIQLTSGYTFSW